jgi:hypothetical protein
MTRGTQKTINRKVTREQKRKLYAEQKFVHKNKQGRYGRLPAGYKFSSRPEGLWDRRSEYRKEINPFDGKKVTVWE